MSSSFLYHVWGLYQHNSLCEEYKGNTIIPNRSLEPEQISLDCWADGCLWVRRRSGLRRE